MDQLNSKQEALWRELCCLVDDMGYRKQDIMLPIWLDESAPKAIQDRAMLVGIGAVTKEFGMLGGGMSYGFSPNLASIQRWATDKKQPLQIEKFAQWLNDLVQYQTAESVQLVDQYHVRGWAIDLFAENLLDEEQLSALIDSNMQKGPANSGMSLGRHPINTTENFVAKELLGVYDDDVSWSGDDRGKNLSPKVRQYFMSQLALLRNSDPNRPAWLDHIRPKIAKYIERQIIIEEHKDAEFIPNDQTRDIIQSRGWGIIVRDITDAIRSLEKIDPNDVEMEESIMIYIADNFTKDRLVFNSCWEDAWRRASQIAERTTNPKIKYYVNRQAELRMQNEAHEKALKAERDADRKLFEKTDPNSIRRRAADKRLGKLILKLSAKPQPQR